MSREMMTKTLSYFAINSGNIFRKINLINTLVHRALMICSKTWFDSELDKIRSIRIENGYPEDVISDCFCKKIASFLADKRYGPLKYPVYLK